MTCPGWNHLTSVILLSTGLEVATIVMSPHLFHRKTANKDPLILIIRSEDAQPIFCEVSCSYITARVNRPRSWVEVQGWTSVSPRTQWVLGTSIATVCHLNSPCLLLFEDGCQFCTWNLQPRVLVWLCISAQSQQLHPKPNPKCS